VTDFNSLRDLIQKNKAGENVPIEINRDNQSLTKQLKLGEWD
jgi:S1-C subfamily serine protease